MKTIKQRYKINASVKKVWKALTDPEIIKIWSGAKAKMSEKEGSEFSLWNGDIYGRNIKVVSQKELAQEWYGGAWDKPSKAQFLLKGDENMTILDLIHEGVPEKEVNDFDQGWKEYYLGPLKDLLEKKP